MMLNPNPTEAERARYEAWLSEAETALHRLSIGVAEVSVDYNGEKVAYTAASRPALRSWINELRAALGMPKAGNRGVAFKPVIFGAPGRGGSGGLY